MTRRFFPLFSASGPAASFVASQLGGAADPEARGARAARAAWAAWDARDARDAFVAVSSEELLALLAGAPAAVTTT